MHMRITYLNVEPEHLCVMTLDIAVRKLIELYLFSFGLCHCKPIIHWFSSKFCIFWVAKYLQDCIANTCIMWSRSFCVSQSNETTSGMWCTLPYCMCLTVEFLESTEKWFADQPSNFQLHVVRFCIMCLELETRSWRCMPPRLNNPRKDNGNHYLH